MSDMDGMRLLRAVMVIREGGSYADYKRALHGPDYGKDKEESEENNQEGKA